MRLSAISSVVFAALSSASPLHTRAGCDVFGQGASNTAPSGFTLVAKHPDNTTSPIYVNQVVTVPHATYSVLSTRVSGTYTTMTLTNGLIYVAAPAAPYWTTVSLGNVLVDGKTLPPPSGPWPAWGTGVGPTTTVSYCSVPIDDTTTLLGSDGHTGAFSLCTSYFSSTLSGVPAIVYTADPTSTVTGVGTYDGSSCTPVVLQIV